MKVIKPEHWRLGAKNWRRGTLLHRQSPSARSNVRMPAFTLIELLIVMTILAVLTALSVAVYIRQLAKSDRAATEALVQMLNDAVNDRLQQFFGEKVFPVLATHRVLAGWDPTLSFTETGELASLVDRRAELIAKLDAMRGDFPQQFIDFMRNDPDGAGPQVGDQDVSGIYVGLSDNSNSRAARTAIYLDYLKRTRRYDGSPQLTGTPPAFSQSTSYDPKPFNHDPATESSECLYLMLTAVSGYVFDVGQVDPRFIKDSDNDGLMEFVDVWGTPLRFYRWPTDCLEFFLRVTKSLPGGLAVNSLDPDGLLTTKPGWYSARRLDFEGDDTPMPPKQGGFFRVHKLYKNATVDMNLDETDPLQARAYPLFPLIVSAGPDAGPLAPNEKWRAFGLAWHDDGRVPEAWDLSERCARIGGIMDASDNFVPDPEMLSFASDNVVSLLLRAGRDN